MGVIHNAVHGLSTVTGLSIKSDDSCTIQVWKIQASNQRLAPEPFREWKWNVQGPNILVR